MFSIDCTLKSFANCIKFPSSIIIQIDMVIYQTRLICCYCQAQEKVGWCKLIPLKSFGFVLNYAFPFVDLSFVNNQSYQRHPPAVRGSNTSAQVSGWHNLSTVGNYRIRETLEE